MVRLRPLEPRIGVRVPASQPFTLCKRFFLLLVYPTKEKQLQPAAACFWNLF